MALATYTDLQTQVANWIARSDLTSNIPDFITLFEEEANRTLRTRQMEANTLLYPSGQITYTVTGAANNGSGLIRLTITTTTTGCPATNDEIFVQSVGGTTEANNTWIVTRISTSPIQIDLQNSVFTNAYTSGGNAYNDSGTATIPSDYLTWRRVTWTGNPARELEYVHPTSMRNDHPFTTATITNNQNIPAVFTIEDNNVFRLRPIDGNAIEFDYYQKIPALSSVSSSTSNWLMAAYPSLYLTGTLYEAHFFMKDYDQASAWEKRRDDIFDRIKLLDQKTRGPAAIRPLMRGIIP